MALQYSRAITGLLMWYVQAGKPRGPGVDEDTMPVPVHLMRALYLEASTAPSSGAPPTNVVDFLESIGAQNHPTPRIVDLTKVPGPSGATGPLWTGGPTGVPSSVTSYTIRREREKYIAGDELTLAEYFAMIFAGMAFALIVTGITIFCIASGVFG